MAYHDSVLFQLLKLVPRLEFEKQENRSDGKRRSDALSRWSQFVALMIGQLGGRRRLRDIEASVRSQRHHRYPLGSQPISRSALGRANEQLDYRFYEGLFQSLYRRCMSKQRHHGFRIKNKLFSLDASLIDVSMKVFPWVKFGGRKSAFKLHLGLDHDGLIPAFACVTQGKVSDMVQARQLAFLKFQSKINKSLQQIIRLLQLNLFTRRFLLDLLQPPEQPGLPPPQLKLGLVRN